jgi:hypothetical protein
MQCSSFDNKIGYYVISIYTSVYVLTLEIGVKKTLFNQMGKGKTFEFQISAQ